MNRHSDEPPGQRDSKPQGDGVQDVTSPMGAFSRYRGEDWTPQRLAFHQNLEAFAEKIGLIVGLQSNGKMSQELAYAEIRRFWNELKNSKPSLLNRKPPKEQH